MTFPSDHEALIGDIVAALRPLLAPKTCVNCTHWQSKPELCTKYAQRPPATVIVAGCPAWYPLIPF